MHTPDIYCIHALEHTIPSPFLRTRQRYFPGLENSRYMYTYLFSKEEERLRESITACTQWPDSSAYRFCCTRTVSDGNFFRKDTAAPSITEEKSSPSRYIPVSLWRVSLDLQGNEIFPGINRNSMLALYVCVSNGPRHWLLLMAALLGICSGALYENWSSIRGLFVMFCYEFSE